MKILLVGNLPEDRQESMRRFTDVLQAGLQGRGHIVEVANPSLRLSRFGPPYRYGGLPKFLGYFDKFVLFPRQLRRVRRTFRPDVVHITDHANAVYRSAAGEVPVLTTCHDLLQVRAARGEMTRQSVSRMGRRYQEWIRTSLGRLRMIACVSTLTRADVLRLTAIPPERTVLIPNSLNYPYQPIPPAEARLRLDALAVRQGVDPASLNSSRGGFLLHVGGALWYKNRDGLIAIYARLRELLTPVPRLVLVGPPLADTDLALAEELGVTAHIVSFQGVTNPELEALYNLAEALVFPSWAEGFGWPVAEAQACGCPVFASNREPMTEVGGDSSVYFDPEKPAEAARDIAAAWPERATRRAQALEEAKRWQLALMLDGYEAVYRQLLQ
ncbi:MAG: glycosyltransferase family 1 protein [Opitutaceae bacterium]